MNISTIPAICSVWENRREWVEPKFFDLINFVEFLEWGHADWIPMEFGFVFNCCGDVECISDKLNFLLLVCLNI